MIYPRSLRGIGILTPEHQTLFGPFNSNIQRRWKKPVDSAQTRLESRTRDSKLDKLATHLKKLTTILEICNLMSAKKRGQFVSLQLMSRWKNIVGLEVGLGYFIQKYPHVFEVFTHSYKKNLCCKVTSSFKDLINEERNAVMECEADAVKRIKKLLMMSKNGTLRVHALRLIRRELGLPEDFRESVLAKNVNSFRLVDLETVELVQNDEALNVAAVEKWREKEYKEKWLSEFETKFAFPINFPTGFVIERGYKELLKNWQRLQYSKPYDKKEYIKLRSQGGIQRFEKQAVAIIHELLSLTVEKMVPVERLAHFRKELCMEVNVCEVLLKHPGIFYISTKGGSQTVFLREAYSKGCLIEPNLLYDVRRKMLDLVFLGCRNANESQRHEEIKDADYNVGREGTRDGEWVITVLENFDQRSSTPITSSDS